MNRLLSNVMCVLLLSTCLLSCSKEDDNVVSVSQKDVAGTWTISTVVDAINKPSGMTSEQSAKFEEFKTELKRVFQQGDEYRFNDNSSCSVTRNGKTAQRPARYEVKDGFIIFDGYIKFKTNLAGDKLNLTAGSAEIREIATVELVKPEYGFDSATVEAICKFLNGNLELGLTKK